MKTVTLTIDPRTREIEVETDGWEGRGCHAVQAAFAKAFGGTTEPRAPSPNPRRSINAFRRAEAER
jgi:hypothetical protein